MTVSSLKSPYTLVFFCCILLLSGCKTKKNNDSKSISGTKSKKEVIHDVLESSLLYNTLSTKGSVELVLGESKKKISATFKIEKDRAMQVSLRDPIIGAIEGARITFTTDSIIILDRMKQRFVAEKYSDSSFSKDLDFNFYNLQALLTNHMFAPGVKKLDGGDHNRFNISVNESNYLVTTKDKNNLQYTFAIDGTDKLTSTLIAHIQRDIALKWDYSDFVTEGNKSYPTTMSAKMSMRNTKMDFVISYSKLDIDKSVQIDTAIPSKYKKISFKEFIDSYIKL